MRHRRLLPPEGPDAAHDERHGEASQQLGEDRPGVVEPLDQAFESGFPLGFWFAHQGSIYTFIVLVWVFALASDRLARRYGVD